MQFVLNFVARASAQQLFTSFVILRAPRGPLGCPFPAGRFLLVFPAFDLLFGFRNQDPADFVNSLLRPVRPVKR